MKNKTYFKKVFLLILIILLLLILIFNFFNTSSFKINNFFKKDEGQAGIKSDSQLIAQADDQIINNDNENINKEKNNIINEKLDQNNLKNKKINIEKKTDQKNTKIIKIEDIKDPFQTKTASNSFKNNLNPNKALLLEKDLNIGGNLTGEGLIIEKEINLKENKKSKLKKEKENEIEDKERLNNLNLPFELLGIIKNKNNSAVILSYKNQNIIKNEKEKIDIFLIEKILNKSLIIKYKKQKREVKLWEAQNEN